MSSNGAEIDEEEETELSQPNLSLLRKILQDGLEDRERGIMSVDGKDAEVYRSEFTFEQFMLKEDVLKGLFSCCFDTPSMIQGIVFDRIFVKNPTSDLIIQSQNGTGKTAAYAICMLQKVNLANSWPQCVCVAPTYELGIQVGDVIAELGQYMNGLRIRCVLRQDATEVRNIIPVTEHIVVGTPGKLLHWIFTERCLDMSRVEMLVIDEADVLFNSLDLGAQMTQMFQVIPRSCSVYLFTATLDEQALRFAQQVTKNASLIRLRNNELVLPNLHQFYVPCEDEQEKFNVIVDVYRTLMIGQCMIFCATKTGARELARKMSAMRHRVSLLTGDLSITERAKTIKEFRDGITRVLVATNVCSRGIDIAYVNLVVNYHLPYLPDGQPDFSAYLHRIGRGGRFGTASVAITLVRTPQDHEAIKAISKHYGKPIECMPRQNLYRLEDIVQPEF